MMPLKHLASPLVLLTLAVMCQPAASHAAEEPMPCQESKKPIVIAHRGASGYVPEHTLAAYAAGDRDGRRLHRAGPGDRPRTACSSPATRTRSADTTDVADHPEFASRKTTKTVDGVSVDRLVHRGLHARRTQDAARQGAPACDPPRQHAPSTASSRSRPSRRSSISRAALTFASMCRHRGTARRIAGASAFIPRPSTRPTSGAWASRWRSRW